MNALIKTRTCGFKLSQRFKLSSPSYPKVNLFTMIHNFAREWEKEENTNKFSLTVAFCFPNFTSRKRNLFCTKTTCKQANNNNNIYCTVYVENFWFLQGKNFSTWHLCSPNEARKSYGSHEQVVWRGGRQGKGEGEGYLHLPCNLPLTVRKIYDDYSRYQMATNSLKAIKNVVSV